MAERKDRILHRIRGMLVVSLGVLGCGLQEHPREGAVMPRSPTTPPAAGIDIDGMHVARDKAIVFVHFGHSNMAGVAHQPAELVPFFFTPQPRLWSYQGGGKFVPAVEPTAPDPSLDREGAGGPGMAWLRTAAALAGPDYHFISVAWARTGASSEEFQKGGVYYSQFMDRALELKGRVTFGGVFIMLGITELPAPLPEEASFAERMARIIADIRKDLDAPDLPVLHTDYEMQAGDRWAITQPLGMRLWAQVEWLPAKVPNLVLIPTNGTPMADNHHFDLTGQKMWAERGIQLMRDHGWFPWTQ